MQNNTEASRSPYMTIPFMDAHSRSVWHTHTHHVLVAFCRLRTLENSIILKCTFRRCRPRRQKNSRCPAQATNTCQSVTDRKKASALEQPTEDGDKRSAKDPTNILALRQSQLLPPWLGGEFQTTPYSTWTMVLGCKDPGRCVKADKSRLSLTTSFPEHAIWSRSRIADMFFPRQERSELRYTCAGQLWRSPAGGAMEGGSTVRRGRDVGWDGKNSNRDERREEKVSRERKQGMRK